MKRIAFVINSIHPGGPSYVVRNIIRNLDSKEYKIFLITLFAENTDDVVQEQKNLGVTVIECDFPGRMQALTKGQKVFAKIIKDNGIEIIHSHGFLPDIMSARIKHKHIKKITTLHNNMFLDYAEAYGDLKSKVYIFAHLHFLKQLDYVACCSQFVLDSMKGKLDNIVLVRNGIDKTTIKQRITRKDIGVPENAVVYIYAGQFRTRKNTLWMINQFNSCHKDDEYLLLVGRGPDTEKCREASGSNTIFYGFTDNPYAFMAVSNIYISASLAEGFSISVLEAMDNGLALFLSDIPAHLEAFKAAKGVSLGECFKTNDVVDFEKKLDVLRKELPGIDRDAIRRIKNKEMSAEKMTKRYEELYASCKSVHRKGY
jgi:glycosyltransferase involved in cell wall biosynthesis